MINPNFEGDKLFEEFVLQYDSSEPEHLIGAITYANFRCKLRLSFEEIKKERPIGQDDYNTAVRFTDTKSLKKDASVTLNDYLKDYEKKDFWYGVLQGIVASFVFSSSLFGLALMVRLSKPSSGIGLVIQYLFSDGEFEIRPKITPSAQPSSNNP